MKCFPTQTPDNIDIEALHAKYLYERDKRLRVDGQKQYAETADDLAGYYEVDPHTPPVERDPIIGEVNVLVLGGGFCGMIAAVELKKAGVEDIRVVEMGGDFGGTWYWNRYPGLQCDNDAYCYLPLLEETGYIPSKKFVDGAEIYAHCQRIAKHYDLYDGAIFGTIVRSLRWDAGDNRWHVATDRGDEIKARFVVMAQGLFCKPKLPAIPGFRDFKGHSFHTARWDYDYTGGNAQGGMTKLADKRVAIIGTGATAVQAVPYLAKDAKHLYVFQRTPSSVDSRPNPPTDPDWVKGLEPGWQRARQRNFHAAAVEGLYKGQDDQICDIWTEISRNLLAKWEAEGWPEMDFPTIMAEREREDYRVMERLRQRVASIVEDPATAEALKPYYRFLCKRPTSNDEFLPAFNRSNVTLVDVSSAKGVERITEKGLVANGVEYEVDCIIYASGFEITTDLERRWNFDTLEGRDGLSIFDHWREGFRTFHGMTAHGFPNQFFTGFTQAAFSANTTAIFEQQGRHIAYIVAETLKRGAATIEVSEEAQDGWVETIHSTAFDNTQFQRECTPGYYNNEGEKKIRSFIGEPYGPGFYAFEDLIGAWREAGDLAGMKLG